ncbi:MAG: hypothetical protein DI566_10500 [Microbacterium sp.]|nr:MAG: hypothetical protein DI566_10500 [Microbacterium sp.]
MTRRPLASVLTLVSTATLALGLAACAPTGDTPSPSGSTGGASSSPKPSSSASASPSASPSADAAACLIGDWTMDQAGLDGFYGDVNTLLEGSGVVFTPQGSAALSITKDGAFTWSPSTQLTAAVSGTEILVTLGGQIVGTYTATGDRIATATQSTDGLVVSATIDGAETDAGAITEQIAAAPITDAAYTCSGDTLTLDSSLAGGTATSVLHRR